MLARAGARLLIAGRDPGRLDAVARDTGALALKADLAEPQGPAELAEAALQVAYTDVHAAGIDLLINNAGVTSVRDEAVYSAAKAGLGNFAESLAYELEGSGVGVCVIVPGVINTPFFERRGRPYGRRKPGPLPAERAAEAIRSVLEHDRHVVYVPRWMSFPARLHGAAPRTFTLLAHRFGDHG